MPSDTPLPQLVPDYGSEENWNSYVARLPATDRIKAPSYVEMKENIDRQVAAFLKTGQTVERVEVIVSDFEQWLQAHHKAFTRESSAQYALHRFVETRTGKAHLFVDPTEE